MALQELVKDGPLRFCLLLNSLDESWRTGFERLLHLNVDVVIVVGERA